MKKLAFILIGLIALSCQDIENCLADDNRDEMIVRFFDLSTREPKKVGFIFTAEGSPKQYFFEADTTISSSGDTTIVSDSTVIKLPLDPESSLTTFYFDSDTSRFELEMSYEMELTIFDPKCDPSITFVNLDTVSYTFDSLSLSGRVTNRQISTNVEVYF